MMQPARHLKFSGMIAPQDQLHQVIHLPPGEMLSDQQYIAPNLVTVIIKNPPPTQTIGVPQYSPTVIAKSTGYDPAGDCNGNFMSAKFQPNNNCYAYGCNISSNSFPQPGRLSGNLITASTLNGPSVANFAEQDGLVFAGKSTGELASFAQKRRAQLGAGGLDGHFVALMISAPSGQYWPGDYHWARCDDNVNSSSWSQKDGGDQVTNFDFAGNPITNPATANWSVNQGPIQPDKSQPGFNPDDMVVDYVFYCFMYVPNEGVDIV